MSDIDKISDLWYIPEEYEQYWAEYNKHLDELTAKGINYKLLGLRKQAEHQAAQEAFDIKHTEWERNYIERMRRDTPERRREIELERKRSQESEIERTVERYSSALASMLSCTNREKFTSKQAWESYGHMMSEWCDSTHQLGEHLKQEVKRNLSGYGLIRAGKDRANRVLWQTTTNPFKSIDESKEKTDTGCIGGHFS